MTRPGFRDYFVVAGGVLIALSLTFTATGSALAQNPQERPFKMSAVGQVISSVPDPNIPHAVDLIAVGSAKATHLGNSQWIFPHTLFLATFTVSGHIGFTAANGDTLVADVTGQLTRPEPGVLDGVWTLTFIGGTGRFVDATGSATMTGTVDNGAIAVTAEGTISY